MIAWAARRPAVVAATCAALLVGGAVSLARIPIAARTTVEIPRIQVEALWPGASAEVIEAHLTAPMEQAVQAVRGVRRTNSESGEGRARIVVELANGADVQLARLAILERLQIRELELPPGAMAPRVTNYVPEAMRERPLVEYAVSGPYSSAGLSQWIETVVVPRLSAVSGVAGVRSWGGTTRGISVTYNAARLRQLGLTPATLADALRQARVIRAIGMHRSGASEWPITLRDQPDSASQLADLPVAGPLNRPYTLGDVASVRFDEDVGGQFFRVDGRPAVMLSVSRLQQADAWSTAMLVHRVMHELEAALPPQMLVRVASDEGVELRAQMTDLLGRSAIALVVVVIVMAGGLQSVRLVGVVMGATAVAAAGTALSVYLVGLPVNVLTLAGLGMGLGVLVQNCLIVAMTVRRAAPSPEARAAAGWKMVPVVLATTLTAIVVLAPFLYLQGNARAAFVPFAATFALALIWSVASSLLVIPALTDGGRQRKAPRHRVRGIYRRLVTGLLRYRWMTCNASLAIVIALAWVFVTQVPRSSIGDWSGARTTLLIRIAFPRGTAPESLEQAIRAFESIAIRRRGVASVVSRGSPEAAFLMVVFERSAGLTDLPYTLEEAAARRALLIGGADVSIHGSGPGFWTGGRRPASSFQVRVLGYSFQGVERLAADFMRRLERIPRVADVRMDASSGVVEPERSAAVVVEPNRRALARYGVTADELARTVAQQIAGVVGVEHLDINGRSHRISLKEAGARERSLDELHEALVPTASGASVRLEDLARVEEREALGVISREHQQYLRVVSYRFRGPARLAQRTHDALMASTVLPPGYIVEDEEPAWLEDNSSGGLWLVFGVGVLLVALSVAVVFDSAWAAVMVLATIPIALAGVVAAFWLTGTTFSREAAVGVIVVIGIAANQAILLVAAALEVRQTSRGGNERTGLTASIVVNRAARHSGMIVLTASVALASQLPMAIGTDLDTLFGAIALAGVGGTLAGAAGTLLVLPAVMVGRARCD